MKKKRKKYNTAGESERIKGNVDKKKAQFFIPLINKDHPLIT